MSESQSQTSSKKDPAWKYASQPNLSDRDSVKCSFCYEVKKGGISRMKQHFVGGFRNTTSCKKCPEHVKEEIKEYMQRKKEVKNNVLLPDFEDLEFGEDEEEEIEEVDPRGKKIKRGTNTSTPKFGKSTSRTMGPMDTYFTPDPEDVVQARKGKRKIVDAFKNEAAKKEMRERACRQITRWMYDAAIPFNAVKHDSFHAMIEAIGQYGPGMKPPTYHEARVTFLKKELDHTKNLMEDHKKEWATHGCTIMSDGWTDKRQRTIINFMVNCPKGTMFVDSIDASSFSKNGDKMFELFDKFIQQIGPDNVVQIVTDSASPNVVAGNIFFYQPLFIISICD